MNTETLSINELQVLEQDLKKILKDNFSEILSRVNYSGQIVELLSVMGLENLLSYRKSIYNRQGKIVVIGFITNHVIIR